MKTETERIANDMQEVLTGNPWYGQSMLTLLSLVDAERVYQIPADGTHSMIELLYHMIAWAEFTLKRLEKKNDPEAVLQGLDWRETNPEAHTWNNGVAQLTAAINKTITFLREADDTLLEEMVEDRPFNFRFLLQGIIHHHIYHLAQITYINKLYRNKP